MSSLKNFHALNIKHSAIIVVELCLKCRSYISTIIGRASLVFILSDVTRFVEISRRLVPKCSASFSIACEV